VERGYKSHHLLHPITFRGLNCKPVPTYRQSKKECQENLKGRDHSEDLGIDGRIILARLLGKQVGNMWTRRM